VRVHFNGGRVEHADILIGGDGIRSTVRGQVAPELQPNYAGYYIWRGAPNEADLSPQTLKEIFPYFVFYLPPRQEVITYPIAGFNDDLRPGHRRYNFIWYRVADAAQLREMNVDENGTQHEFSVPPPLIRKDLIAQMYADAREIMPPVMLDCVMTMKQPLSRRSTISPRRKSCSAASPWSAMPPPTPARTWASAWRRPAATPRRWRARSAITTTSTPALKAYNAERQPIGNTIVMHSRKLGTHMGVDLKTEEDRRMHALLQNDGAMMDWIAVPNFLDAYK
jgi:2-polyprenyl-6-methoxyphenol hydroxylase-like FAD-dependent oxidoreductase